MRTNLPLITIGLPVFNGERYLSKALNSLLSQTYKNIEILILDNFSNDLTENICQDYILQDNRVRYFRNDNNIGPFPNINKALKLSKGKFFMWSAYDDLWEPDYIYTLINLLELNEPSTLAFSLETRIGESDESIVSFKQLTNLFKPSDSKFIRVLKFIKFSNQEILASLFYGIYKRGEIIEIGGLSDFDSEYWGRDLHFLLKVLIKGSFVQENRFLFYKRVMNEKPYSFVQLSDFHFLKKHFNNFDTLDLTSGNKFILLYILNDLLKSVHNWNQIYLGYNKILLKSDFNFFAKLIFSIVIAFILFIKYTIEILKCFRKFQIMKNKYNA